MKICIVITNLAGGGAERATIDLIKAFQKKQHHVTLILLNSKVEHDLPSDVDVHFLTKATKSKNRGWLGRRVLAYRFRLLWRKLNAQHGFQFTLSRLPFCWEIVHLSKIPNPIYYVDNSLSDELSKLAEKSKSKSIRRFSRYVEIFKSRRIVACSEGVHKDLCRLFKDKCHSISLINNPVDFEEVKNKSDMIDLEVPNYKYVIHVGRFNAQKRHDILLEAWRQVFPILNFKLILLTNENDELTRLIHSFQLEDAVIVQGFKKNPYPWIKNSEMLVLSSDHEGLGLVLVEAILCGTRVVSTDCDFGPAEVLNYHLDLLVPCNDPKALSEMIVHSLKKPKPNWRYDFSRFDGGKIVDSFEKFSDPSK